MDDGHLRPGVERGGNAVPLAAPHDMSASPHRLTVTGDAAAVATVSAWVRSLGNEAQLLPADVFRLDLCVSELIANIADHGFAENGNLRHRSCKRSACRTAKASASRSPTPARSFDPLAVPSASSRRGAIAEAPIGGLGIHLVRTYADECHYERRGERNVFAFLIRRSPAVAETGGRRPDRPRSRAAPRQLAPRFSGNALERDRWLPHDERGGGDRRLLGFISTCDIFRNVPYGLIETLVARCPVRSYPRGPRPSCAQGTATTTSALVVEGSLRVHLGHARFPRLHRDRGG